MNCSRFIVYASSAALLGIVACAAFAQEPADVPPGGASDTAAVKELPLEELLPDTPETSETTGTKETGPAGVATWVQGLQAGIREGQKAGKPLLVFAGVESSRPSRRFADQLVAPPLGSSLGQWTLVYVDVDKRPDDARLLGVATVPVLHVFNVRGIFIASRDGFASPEELSEWLTEYFEKATAPTDPSLLEEGELSVLEIVRLIRQLPERDPTLREAAIGRLAENPLETGAPVVKAFGEGNLATRLAALEILEQWKAPVGELDPWRSETVTLERLTALRQWQESYQPEPEPETDEPVETLSEADLATARQQIERLLGASGIQAAAIRGRLSRYGAALLPEVYERLGQAPSDEAREKLLSLRYRLVAGDSLVIRWPGGIARLASSDADERRQAAQQLKSIATAGDQALLQELFSDPDPLIRELSLQSLQHIGGPRATASLAKLLKDPEPNVRAAVLKLLAEDTSVNMLAEVAEYVKDEQDPDLLVHAIRYLKASPSSPSMRLTLQGWFEAQGGTDQSQTARVKATEALLWLLDHESWQVRAEAAEALGEAVNRLDVSKHGSLKADAYVALIEHIEDPDAFVVSRAVSALEGVDMEMAVEPLVKAIAEHPELGPQIIEMLVENDDLHEKALPYLQRFRTHEVAAIRAVTIPALVRLAPAAVDVILTDGIEDPDSAVRRATMQAVMEQLDAIRRAKHQSILQTQLGSSDPSEDLFSGTTFVVEEPQGSLMSRAIRALVGGLAEQSEAADEEEEEGEDEKEDEGEAEAPGEAPGEDEPVDSEEENDAAEVEDGDAADEQIASPDLLDLLDPPDPPNPSDSNEPNEPETGTLKDNEEENDEADTDENPAGRQWDAWLEEFHAGKDRPKWTGALVEPLRAMLASEDLTERLTAAGILVPLGHADESLPVIREVVAARHDLLARATGVLPWLPWQSRQALFDEWMTLATEPADRIHLVRALARVLDYRAADRIWEMVEDPGLDPQMADVLSDALCSVYYGSTYQNDEIENDALRQEIVAAATPRVESGSDLQRLVALAQLVAVAPEQGAELARGLADDESLGGDLRREALQVLLVASAKEDRRPIALSAIESDEPARRILALRYFVEGIDGLTSLRDGSLSIRNPYHEWTSHESGKPIIPLPPKGLKKQHVLPLLKHDELHVRAYAGYLLAVMEDPQGMPGLIEYYREQPDADSRKRLVYRAIAALDDSDRLPILKTIYQGLDTYDMDEFYWTIRIMSGPEVLKFRKEIRDRLGMNILR